MYPKSTLFLLMTLFSGVVSQSPPTVSPTSSPSEDPSSQPSSQPSESPSSDPSSDPSSAPSSTPSTQPSTTPSAIPSTQPSASPSSTPSTQPSASPSDIPSSIPSASPSDAPSATPSVQPSVSPSATPSAHPSSMPSALPSSQPSAMPSSMPSCTPSQSPTPPTLNNLFYPDWSPGGTQGCLRDGAEPAYMVDNPVFLSTTLDACCQTYFSWNYDSCMGFLDDTCTKALWYPDWEGANRKCLRDGAQPYYMIQNKVNYLFNTKKDCCDEHYSWNLVECMGSAAPTSGKKYYADWTGADTCKNDGNAPTYMVQNPTLWLYDSLSSCCEKSYNYKLSACLNGGTPPAPAPGSGLFYPDWTGANNSCLNDGNEPDYMASNPTLWMHATLQACCEKNYPYDLPTCTGSTPVGSGKWYINWTTQKCVQDNGSANSWDIKYDTKQICCSERYWWDEASCMV